MKILDKFIKYIIFLLIFVFIGLPFLYVFKEAFTADGGNSIDFILNVFKENKNLFVNSITVGFIVSVLTTVFSAIIGLYCFLSGKIHQKIISAILLVTMISPPFVTSLSYINLFGRRGFITYNLLKLNTNPYGMTGIILMETLGFLSLSCLMVISYLNNLDTASINSAVDLGANTNHVVIDILIPQLKNTLISVFFLTFIRSIADFGTPAIIGGKFNVLASEGYMSVISKGDIKTAAVINIMILIPSVIMFIIYSKSMRKSNVNSNSSQSAIIDKKSAVFYFLCVISVFLLSWLVIQYASIILSAFTKMKNNELTFTFENFRNSKSYITNTITRSIVYSLISAFFGSMIGLLMAYYSIIKKSKVIKVADYISNLPYILPGTFFGLGYLLAFSHKPLMLVGTSAIVVLNVLFKQMPFSTKVMNSHVLSISEDEINSAQDLGANFIYVFKDIVLPLTKKGFTVTFINAFTATMTTIGSIIFLVYPGQKVLTLVMFDVINSGNYNIGSVIALIIILICLVVNGGYYLATKIGDKKWF